MLFILNDKLQSNSMPAYDGDKSLLEKMQKAIEPDLRPTQENNWKVPYNTRHIGGYSPAPGSVNVGSMLGMLRHAYTAHHSITFGPHDLWYVVLSEIASLVNSQPQERFRSLFTRQTEGKTEILVLTDDPTVLPLGALMTALRELVPANIDTFFPKFSTNTPESDLACMAAFADTVKTYYSYAMMCCGIKAVEVLGTVADWQMFRSHANELQQMLGRDDAVTTAWFTGLQNRAQLIADSLQGGPSDFYKDIYTDQNIGSGGDLEVNGWYAREMTREPCRFPKIENFPKNWSMVPYKNIKTKREFVSVHGCLHASFHGDGFLTPGYGYQIFEKKPQDAS